MFFIMTSYRHIHVHLCCPLTSLPLAVSPVTKLPPPI